MADERDPSLENDEIRNTSEEAIVDSADDEFEDVDEDLESQESKVGSQDMEL
jgi:hypothetical protein